MSQQKTKPMPIKDNKGKLIGIIGNMFDKGSTPAFTRIDGKEIGSCFAIQSFDVIPGKFCPETPLQADTVKETNWEKATTEIVFITLLTVVPLPCGKEFESTSFDDSFVKEMEKISSKHGFWARTMTDVIEQAETENDNHTIVGRLLSSRGLTRQHDPICTATKGIHEMTATASPFIDTTFIGAKHNHEQAEVKRFFHHNLTPSWIEIINNDEEQPELCKPIHSGGAPMNENPSMATAPSTSIPAAIAANPATGIPPKISSPNSSKP
jgi:hypothetical protein